MGSIEESMKLIDREKLSELLESGSLNENEYEVVNGRYYSTRLGLSDDDEENVIKLYDFYLERINDKSTVQAVRETIHEYIIFFNLRELDGPEVVAHKIAMVGRKSDTGKKNLSYLIGCLRNVLEYGLSATNSPMEKRLICSFEEHYGFKLSPNGRQKLFSIAANFSTVEMLFCILENNINIEELFLDKFERVLNLGR